MLKFIYDTAWLSIQIPLRDDAEFEKRLAHRCITRVQTIPLSYLILGRLQLVT